MTGILRVRTWKAPMRKQPSTKAGLVHSARGFVLIEVLMVVGLLGLMAAVVRVRVGHLP